MFSPILQVLINPILPVAAIMAMGFVAGRVGFTSADAAREINRFAMTVLLPILLFGLLANSPVHTFSFTPIAIYGATEFAIFAAGFLIARRLLKRDTGESVLLAFSGIFTNNAFYVLPISRLLYGDDAVLPITAIITFDATIPFAGSLILLQMIRLGRASPVGVAVTIIKSPILLSIIAGLVFACARIPVPAPVTTFLSFNGSAAAPVALFALGVVLSQTVFRADPAVFIFSLVKLFLFPLVIWAGILVLIPDEAGQNLYLFGAAGPAGTMAFSLALLFNIRTDAVLQIIIWTSIVSLFTLAILA